MKNILIIGAGVIGLSCGYQLAKRGYPVQILEKDRPGAGQSTKTGGGIRYCHGTPENITLSSLSRDFWKCFSKEFGIDTGYQETGHLFLSSETKQLETLFSVGTKNSLDLKKYNKNNIRSIWPELSAVKAKFGVYCSIGGYLDHQKVIDGLSDGLKHVGGKLINDVKVTELYINKGKVEGVYSTAGLILSDRILNCSGADVEEFTKTKGNTKYFKSRHHELIVVAPKRPVPDRIPWLIDIDRQVHLRPNGSGQALIGGFLGKDEAVDLKIYSPSTSKEWLSRVIEVTQQAFDLSGTSPTVLRHWSGLYPGTNDYLPIIEETAPGFYTIAGFSGTGLMHAPAVGEIVSDLVIHGNTDIINLEKFQSSRLYKKKITIENSGF